MKKLSALVLMLCMLVSLTGCTPVQKDLLDEMSKVNDWEATTISQQGTMVMTIGGQKQQMNIQSEGYLNNKTFQGHMTTKVNDPTQQQNLPAMEMYIDQGKTYINKGYFEQIYTSSDLPIPKKLRNITADYIGIDSVNQDMMSMVGNMSTTEMTAKTVELYEKLGKELNLNFDVTKSGNTYTINLDGEDFKQIINQLVKEKKLDRCLELFTEAMGIDLTTLVGTMPTITDEDIAELLSALEPAKLEIKYTISDSEFTQDMKMSYSFDEISMEMDLVSTNKKAAAKTVAIPTSKVDLTMEEYQNLLTTNAAIVQLSEGMLMGTTPAAMAPKQVTILKENNETYLPVRALMETLGYQVLYDGAKQQVTVVTEDATLPVNVVLKGQTSYISLTELAKHQFTVKTVDANTLMILE